MTRARSEILGVRVCAREAVITSQPHWGRLWGGLGVGGESQTGAR